jgi:hypothetical protein
MLEALMVGLEETSVQHKLAHELELKEMLHDLPIPEARQVQLYILQNPPTEICRVYGPQATAKLILH